MKPINLGIQVKAEETKGCFLQTLVLTTPLLWRQSTKMLKKKIDRPDFYRPSLTIHWTIKRLNDYFMLQKSFN